MRTVDEPVSLAGRDLLSVADLSVDEVRGLFASAARLKDEFRETRRHEAVPLQGRTIAMLFQRPSLRTRVTFEAGMSQLGGHAVYLTHETVPERARASGTSRATSTGSSTGSSRAPGPTRSSSSSRPRRPSPSSTA
jgi:hypothetical protein